jgi:hypothetical protein
MECVRGAYLEDDFLRVIEVSSDMQIVELHQLIRDLIGFTDEQLHDCFIATRLRGKKTRFMPSQSHPESTPEADMSITVAEIYAAGSRRRLFYSFNFGDNWIFEVKKVTAAPKRNPETQYPRIIQEEGTQPM